MTERIGRSLTLLGLVLALGCSVAAEGASLIATNSIIQPGPLQTEDKVVLPKSVPDPWEPFNRAMWNLNMGLMTGVMKPSSKVYRFIVRKPLRTGIGNFGRNLNFPDRLINNLLQAKWTGARDET